jgi:nucleoside-diphosphate-sugar epimerase
VAGSRRGEYKSGVAENRFDGRRVAVTGAGGFIGGAVCRRLRAEGAEVMGLDVGEGVAKAAEAGATAIEADVTRRETLGEPLAGVDLVVHTAAYVREWGEMEDFVRLNVRGTANVLQAAEDAGAKRVLHLSSVVVYGYDDPSDQGPDAYRRVCGIPYIDTKSASDWLACRRGAVVIRPGDIYGPGSVPWVLRPLELASQGQLAVPGKGDGVMLACYIDDLVEAIVLALERGEPGEAYAVWNDTERVTFREFFEGIAAIAGAGQVRALPRGLLEMIGSLSEGWARIRDRPPRFSARAATFIDRRGTASVENTRERLGWAPAVGLEEGLRRTGRWAREQALV